ncbi:MAG: hypothetical protein MUO53_00600 [Maribacter sp.]|nr:hypothetical protein [Maribacter sp.]
MKKQTKNNSFKTPEGYFEEFTDKLMGRLSEEKSTSTNLDIKKDGFKVPEGYFANLNEKILSQVAEQETKVVTLHRYRDYYSVAATVAAIVVLALGIIWNTSQAVTFDSLANSDIEYYFENNDIDLSAIEIAEVFPIDDLDIGDIMNQQLNEDNIIDYLNNHVDDFEELNLENDE